MHLQCKSKCYGIIRVYSIAVSRGGFALKRKRKSKIEFEKDNTKQNHVGRWDRIIAVFSIIIGEKKDKTKPKI